VELAEVALDLGPKPSAQFHEETARDLLDGIVILRHTGAAYEKSESRDGLYYRYTTEPHKTRKVPLTFIPYYAWANRAATQMEVWTPVLKT
jgi:DUF1680 family protein